MQCVIFHRKTKVYHCIWKYSLNTQQCYESFIKLKVCIFFFKCSNWIFLLCFAVFIHLAGKSGIWSSPRSARSSGSTPRSIISSDGEQQSYRSIDEEQSSEKSAGDVNNNPLMEKDQSKFYEVWSLQWSAFDTFYFKI